ncbi:MAG: SGNH/GDSL hydrolase family protein, partial [Myxococcota bacterium]
MVPRSAIAWLVVACASPAADAPSPRDFPPLDGNAQILGIGDSIMAFNEPDQDITAVVADELDTTHELAAVGGETMLGDEANRIPWQYEVARDGQYALVIATGGGNDLGECTCGVSCDPVLDTLISADATSGAIVDLVEQGIADGRQFAWV